MKTRSRSLFEIAGFFFFIMTNKSSFDLPIPDRTDEPPPDDLKNLLIQLMRGKNLTRRQARNLLDELLK